MLDRWHRVVNDDFKLQLADQNAIIGFQQNLALDAFTIHKRAVRAAQIAESNAKIINRKDAMMSTDGLAIGAQLAILLTPH